MRVCIDGPRFPPPWSVEEEAAPTKLKTIRYPPGLFSDQRYIACEPSPRVLVECPDVNFPYSTARRGRLVMSKAIVLGVAALALSAGAASAQYVTPGYGYGYGYGAPLYDYAASGYGYAAPAVAPVQGATTIIIVTPAPAYTAPQVYAAPPVATGYYAAAASQPLYNYAPGYGYGYTPGYWNRGYWGRYYGW